MTVVFWLYVLKESFKRDVKMFLGKMIRYLEFVLKSKREGAGND